MKYTIYVKSEDYTNRDYQKMSEKVEQILKNVKFGSNVEIKIDVIDN